jgi:hypothetical protein
VLSPYCVVFQTVKVVDSLIFSGKAHHKHARLEPLLAQRVKNDFPRNVRDGQVELDALPVVLSGGRCENALREHQQVERLGVDRLSKLFLVLDLLQVGRKKLEVASRTGPPCHRHVGALLGQLCCERQTQPFGATDDQDALPADTVSHRRKLGGRLHMTARQARENSLTGNSDNGNRADEGPHEHSHDDSTLHLSTTVFSQLSRVAAFLGGGAHIFLATVTVVVTTRYVYIH